MNENEKNKHRCLRKTLKYYCNKRVKLLKKFFCKKVVLLQAKKVRQE